MHRDNLCAALYNSYMNYRGLILLGAAAVAWLALWVRIVSLEGWQVYSEALHRIQKERADHVEMQLEYHLKDYVPAGGKKY